MGEADGTGDGTHLVLVAWVQRSVLQAHSQAADAGIIHSLQVPCHSGNIHGLADDHHLAGGAHVAGALQRGALSLHRAVPCAAPLAQGQGHQLIHLHHRVIQHVWAHHLQVKDPGARLSANVQHVPEACTDCQRAALAGALQQGVGGHRGAHADLSHSTCVDRSPPWVGHARVWSGRPVTYRALSNKPRTFTTRLALECDEYPRWGRPGTRGPLTTAAVDVQEGSGTTS